MGVNRPRYCSAALPSPPNRGGLCLGSVGAHDEAVEAALGDGGCGGRLADELVETPNPIWGPVECLLLVRVQLKHVLVGAAFHAQADALADVRGVEPRLPVDLDGPEGGVVGFRAAFETPRMAGNGWIADIPYCVAFSESASFPA